MVDLAIASINMEECYRRRLVRGRDLNEWFTQLEVWLESGQYEEALSFLGEAIGAVETLEQFDNREPQSYWYQKAADVYEDMGQPGNAAKVLQRWLASWPAHRQGNNSDRHEVCSRLLHLSRVAQ